MAMASAGIAMMRRVSRSNGSAGKPIQCGRESGSLPRSATVGSSSFNHDASTLSTTMQINGEGIARTPGSGRRGNP
ncbi:hypothetical protein D3C72_2437790 [compost metagenome]